MIGARRRFALVMLLVAGPVAAGRGESFDEIEKKLDGAAKSVNSLHMKSSMDTKMTQAGFEMVSTMTGTYCQVRKGDKVMMRMEGDATTKQKMGDMEQTSQQKTLVVSDGDIVYTMSEMNGTKTVVKSKAPSDEQPWSAMKADHDFKVLPDEKVDGADCFVFEIMSKSRPAGDQSRMLYYCRKDCGFPVKMLSYDAAGAVVTTMTYTDVKMNESIPDDKFKFEIPQGVQVMDMTGN